MTQPHSIIETPADSIYIGEPIVGGTAGSILFVGPTGNLAQNNAALFWDNPNRSLQVSQPSGTVSDSGRFAIPLALGPGAVGEYLFKATPDPAIAPGNKNFNITMTAFGNPDGTRNNVHMKYGYNMSRTAIGAEDTTDPAIGLVFESYYRPNAGQILTEGYFQYWPQGGGAELQRPFMFNVNQINNFMTTYFGSDDFQWTGTASGKLLIRTVASTYATVMFDSATNQRLILDAGNAQVRLNDNGSQSAALFHSFHAEGLNPGMSLYDTGAAADAHLWAFYVTFGQFQIQTINDIASVGNNVVTVTRTGVVVNAITLFGTQLGFFGTTAVAKQTAAGIVAGYTANVTANVVYDATTFTGNVGATAYTIGDVIAALKNYGLLVL